MVRGVGFGELDTLKSRELVETNTSILPQDYFLPASEECTGSPRPMPRNHFPPSLQVRPGLLPRLLQNRTVRYLCSRENTPGLEKGTGSPTQIAPRPSSRLGLLCLHKSRPSSPSFRKNYLVGIWMHMGKVCVFLPMGKWKVWVLECHVSRGTMWIRDLYTHPRLPMPTL